MNKATVMIDISTEVRSNIDRARSVLKHHFNYPHVLFDLRGTTAGLAYSRENKIRFNINMAIDHHENFVETIVPHEVAHIIADTHYGKRCAHGPEWKYIMQHVYNLEPTRCHKYDISKYKAKITRRHIYKCECDQHCEIGTKHHNKIQRGNTKIYCVRCKTYLKIQDYVSSVTV